MKRHLSIFFSQIWTAWKLFQNLIFFFPFSFLHLLTFLPFLSLLSTLSKYWEAAAAAKSLQSCPTPSDPIDGSPPGSPIPGILQARTLEWVAISLSNAWKSKVKVKSLSCVRLSVTPWTAAFQAPSSMGFSRQEYWSGVPLPSQSIVLYNLKLSCKIIVIKCSWVFKFILQLKSYVIWCKSFHLPNPQFLAHKMKRISVPAGPVSQSSKRLKQNCTCGNALNCKAPSRCRDILLYRCRMLKKTECEGSFWFE